MAIGFVLGFLSLALLVRPGVSDIRTDWSDSYDDRRHKGRSWIAAIKEQPLLQWFYGGAVALGFTVSTCVDAYLQGDSLTGWAIPLRLLAVLTVMGSLGWWFTRPTKA